MLNRASQSPIPPLNTNVGVAAAVVAVIVEGTALISQSWKARKHLEKPGMLNFTKEQQLKTRDLSLLGGGRGDVSSFLCLGPGCVASVKCGEKCWQGEVDGMSEVERLMEVGA